MNEGSLIQIAEKQGFVPIVTQRSESNKTIIEEVDHEF